MRALLPFMPFYFKGMRSVGRIVALHLRGCGFHVCGGCVSQCECGFWLWFGVSKSPTVCDCVDICHPTKGCPTPPGIIANLRWLTGYLRWVKVQIVLDFERYLMDEWVHTLKHPPPHYSVLQIFKQTASFTMMPSNNFTAPSTNATRYLLSAPFFTRFWPDSRRRVPPHRPGTDYIRTCHPNFWPGKVHPKPLRLPVL